MSVARHRFVSLRTQLLGLLLLAVLPGLAALVVLSHLNRESNRDTAIREGEHLAEMVGWGQSQALRTALDELHHLADLYRLVPTGEPEACNRLMRQFINQHPSYLNAGLIAPNGRIVCSALPFKPDTDLSDRSYFRQAMAGDGPGVGEYQVGRLTGQPSLNIGLPIRNLRKLSTGVLYLAVSLDWFAQAVRNPALPAGAYVAMIDQSGHILTRYPQAASAIGTRFPLHAVFSAPKADSVDNATEYRIARGERWIYIHNPLSIGQGQSPIYTIVAIPAQQIDGPIDRQFQLTLAIVLASSLLVLLLAWFGARRMVLKPLQRLTQAATLIGRGQHGDFDWPDNRNEFGTLGRAFRQMDQELAARDTEIKHAQRALKTLGEANRSLIKAVDETSFLQRMCEIAVAEGGYIAAWIGLARSDGAIELMAGHTQPGTEIDQLPTRIALRWDDTLHGRGPVGQTIRSGRPRVFRPDEDDPAFAAWRALLGEAGVRLSVALPLILQEGVAGVLIIHNREPHAFQPREVGTLSELAADIGFGITGLRLKQRHREARRAIREASRYDPVTGTLSRSSFYRRFSQWVRRRHKQEQLLAVVIVNVCQFGAVNVAFGYEQGDHILAEIGMRLQSLEPEPLAVGRWGGAEFALLIEVAQQHALDDIVEHLSRALDPPVTTAQIELEAETCIGLSVYPAHGEQVGQLLTRARAAMERARGLGTRYAVHEGSPEREATRHLQILTHLRTALDDDQLSLHYQPKIDLASGRVSGVEALMRWQHPEWGNVRPDEFIPLTEQTRLIQPLTEWTLQQALRDRRFMLQRGIDVPIAVNLSSGLLRSREIVRMVAQVLSEPPGNGWLQLELTETAMMEDPERSLQILRELVELGAPIHVDDFGAGYSSLGYLQRLPVDTIKIDRVLIQHVDRDARSAALTGAAAEFAHVLGLKVIAEGVETATLYRQLADLGCDAVQGYFIARPMPRTDFIDWFERQGGRFAPPADADTDTG